MCTLRCLLSGILEEDNYGKEFVQINDNNSDSYQDVDDVEVSVMEEEEDTEVQRMTTSPITGGESTARNTTSPQSPKIWKVEFNQILL